MGVVRFVGAAGVGLALAASVAVSGTIAAEAGLSGYQGAWLIQGPSCTETYSSAGKGVSFKKPVDMFRSCLHRLRQSPEDAHGIV